MELCAHNNCDSIFDVFQPPPPLLLKQHAPDLQASSGSTVFDLSVFEATQTLISAKMLTYFSATKFFGR